MTELEDTALREVYSEMKPFSLGLMSQKMTTARYDVWDVWQSMQMQTLAIQAHKPLSKEAIEAWDNLIDEMNEIKERLQELDGLIDDIGFSGDE